MNRCAFVGRHTPTEDQIRLAAEAGYELVPVGDFDAFDTALIADDLFAANMDCEAIAAVHPLICLEAAALGFTLLIFRNTNRAPVGQPPQFATDAVVVVTPNFSEDGFSAFSPLSKWIGAEQYPTLTKQV